MAEECGSIIVRFTNETNALTRGLTDLLQCMKTLFKDVELEHLETRKPLQVVDDASIGQHWCCLVNVKGSIDDVEKLTQSLKELTTVDTVTTTSEIQPENPVWIPRQVNELDQCQHLLTKYQPELQTNHPGFNDQEYRERRRRIANIALNYKCNEVIPDVEYSEDEQATWKAAYQTIKKVTQNKASAVYLRGIALFEEAKMFDDEKIPNMRVLSEFLWKTTGFTLRPTAGLVSPRDFLGHLAYRVFPCTQYIRHHSRPEYTPEPDLIHEYLGHLPFFVDRKFADFMQELGLASLGVSEEELMKMTTVSEVVKWEKKVYSMSYYSLE